MSKYKEDEEKLKRTAKEEYGKYREDFKRALMEYEILFKEWERTGDEEIGKKSDEAYEELQKAKQNRDLLAVVWLERLIDDGII